MTAYKNVGRIELLTQFCRRTRAQACSQALRPAATCLIQGFSNLEFMTQDRVGARGFPENRGCGFGRCSIRDVRGHPHGGAADRKALRVSLQCGPQVRRSSTRGGPPDRAPRQRHVSPLLRLSGAFPKLPTRYPADPVSLRNPTGRRARPAKGASAPTKEHERAKHIVASPARVARAFGGSNPEYREVRDIFPLALFFGCARTWEMPGRRRA